MNEEKLEQRIKNIYDRYNELIDNASNNQKKEKLRNELDIIRRFIYFGAAERFGKVKLLCESVSHPERQPKKMLKRVWQQ